MNGFVQTGQIWMCLGTATPDSTIVIKRSLSDGEWEVANYEGDVSFVVPMAEDFLLQNYALVEGL